LLLPFIHRACWENDQEGKLLALGQISLKEGAQAFDQHGIAHTCFIEEEQANLPL